MENDKPRHATSICHVEAEHLPASVLEREEGRNVQRFFQPTGANGIAMTCALGQSVENMQELIIMSYKTISKEVKFNKYAKYIFYTVC